MASSHLVIELDQKEVQVFLEMGAVTLIATVEGLAMAVSMAVSGDCCLEAGMRVLAWSCHPAYRHQIEQ